MFSVLGFIQGSGVASAGNFSSNNARDFIRDLPSVSGSVTAAYSLEPRRINGRVTNSSGSVQFAGQAIPTSAYDYNRAASISTIQGSWTLGNLLGEPMALTVHESGSFAATTSTFCALTGTVMPRASGKNVFNVEFRFGGAPCLLPNGTGRGIAVAYRLANGQTQLLVAAVDGNRTFGSAAFGTR